MIGIVRIKGIMLHFYMKNIIFFDYLFLYIINIEEGGRENAIIFYNERFF